VTSFRPAETPSTHASRDVPDTELTLVTIRRIRSGDGASSRALRVEALADTPVAFAETLAHALGEPASRWDDFAASASTGSDLAAFVAVDQKTLVGNMIGRAMGHMRTNVQGVYLSPPYRGAGLVERLLDEVARWSVAAGRPELALLVAEENRRAVLVYRRLGFEPTGWTCRHPVYPDLIECEMVRPA
jgi:ribosomal protein S18 acetylase RimI-like enzyme